MEDVVPSFRQMESTEQDIRRRFTEDMNEYGWLGPGQVLGLKSQIEHELQLHAQLQEAYDELLARNAEVEAELNTERNLRILAESVWNGIQPEYERVLTERDRYKAALVKIAAMADWRRTHLAELSDRQMIARYALKEGKE